MTRPLPVAVVGGGPVGLAAAAHLVDRGIPFILFEAGSRVGASVSEWGHVRFFSPWRFTVDPTAARLLAAAGWDAPDEDAHPSGAEIIDRYLRPLAELPPIADGIRLAHRVVAVGRQGTDKLQNGERDERPFVVTVDTPQGTRRHLARAVIDATGTWQQPNPLGADGTSALGEHTHRDRLTYGIPDVGGRDRDRYAGRRIAVVGSGHSAQNVVRDLATLRVAEPDTSISWVLRRPAPGQMFGGGGDDQLPERGKLGTESERLVTTGQVRPVFGFRVDSLESAVGGGVVLRSVEGAEIGPFDEVVVATGFRPDLSFLRELRLDLDPTIESTRALAPLIDPNFHSCGTVPPHGEAELRHPESGVYLVGMKSYGRAPSFLLATGHEQVRSVVAFLAGDIESARRVELVLPETGVCAVPDRGLEVEDTASSCCDAPVALVAARASSCC